MKSTYLRDALLNWFRGTAFPAVPSFLYFSLHTGDPGLTGANEVNSGTHAWYARVALVPNGTNWEAPSTEGSNRKIRNDAAVTFASPTTSVTVTHVGIWDASTGGNFLRGGALTTSRSLVNGDNAPSFAADAYVMQEG